MYRIRLNHSFDAAHRVVGHNGKCARLHGHTYLIEVHLEAAELVDPGFVMDFADIKKVINEWDHRCLLWDEDPMWSFFTGYHDEWGLTSLPFNPTSENMSRHLAQTLADPLSEHSWQGKVEVMLSETPKSASWWTVDW